jgi:hypothetical protein
MKKFDWKYVPVFVIFALSLALAPVFRAQDQGSLTRITPVPADAQYTVDGQPYSQASSAVWPTGSKHVLAVPSPTQSSQIGVKYVFRSWNSREGFLQSAGDGEPSVSWNIARFRHPVWTGGVVLPLRGFDQCPGSPGTVTWAAYNGSGNVPGGESAILQAFRIGICLCRMAARANQLFRASRTR